MTDDDKTPNWDWWHLLTLQTKKQLSGPDNGESGSKRTHYDGITQPCKPTWKFAKALISTMLWTHSTILDQTPTIQANLRSTFIGWMFRQSMHLNKTQSNWFNDPPKLSTDRNSTLIGELSSPVSPMITNANIQYKNNLNSQKNISDQNMPHCNIRPLKAKTDVPTDLVWSTWKKWFQHQKTIQVENKQHKNTPIKTSY